MSNMQFFLKSQEGDWLWLKDGQVVFGSERWLRVQFLIKKKLLLLLNNIFLRKSWCEAMIYQACTVEKLMYDDKKNNKKNWW
jgi:hypothetical protein